jgi:hypothetical protein
MQEEQIREARNTHWHALAAGDANAEHDIYDDDAIFDYPQSGARILGPHRDRSCVSVACRAEQEQQGPKRPVSERFQGRTWVIYPWTERATGRVLIHLFR